jgi:hypothetical protein
VPNLGAPPRYLGTTFLMSRSRKRSYGRLSCGRLQHAIDALPGDSEFVGYARGAEALRLQFTPAGLEGGTHDRCRDCMAGFAGERPARPGIDAPGSDPH